MYGARSLSAGEFAVETSAVRHGWSYCRLLSPVARLPTQVVTAFSIFKFKNSIALSSSRQNVSLTRSDPSPSDIEAEDNVKKVPTEV
jgi:hypothetical protein